MNFKEINKEELFNSILDLLEYNQGKGKWVRILELVKEPCGLDSDIGPENLRGWFKNERKKRGFFNKCQKIWVSGRDEEIIIENVKCKKETQRYRDSNRIERKSFREYARIDNALLEYNKNLIQLLKENNISKQTTFHTYEYTDNPIGIFHFTDAHFNELVNIINNKYDFTIASKRCQKFVDMAKNYFISLDVKKIVFAMTGDIINSDRRLDELLSQATNRSKATLLAVDIIKQMLLDLNRWFNITVISVTGNESRVKEKIGYSDLVATDNYDWTISEILKRLFEGSTGITFEYSDDSQEKVLDINGQNVLFLHGYEITEKTEHTVQQIIGRYAAKGININFIIFGHLHSCRIGDTYARGSSVVGANKYSDLGLNLVSLASQNIHIVYDKYSRDSIRIDLQDASNYEGYDINKSLEAYHTKSEDKLKEEVTIFKVVI